MRAKVKTHKTLYFARSSIKPPAIQTLWQHTEKDPENYAKFPAIECPRPRPPLLTVSFSRNNYHLQNQARIEKSFSHKTFSIFSGENLTHILTFSESLFLIIAKNIAYFTSVYF